MEQLALFDNCVANTGVSKTPRNTIEVIQPMPLSDLMFFIDLVNEGGHKSRKADSLQKLGRGAFGTVLGYKDYAIKYFRDGASCYDHRDSNNIPTGEIRDAYILKELQSIKAIPRIYAVIDNIAVIMEKVDGENADDYRMRVRQEYYKPERNYISPDFNKVFEESLKDILHLGFDPHDLHGYNVMVCRKTGLPKIVDVGLFKKFVKDYDLKLFADRDKISFDNSRPARDAMGWIHSPMKPFVDRKVNPEKYIEVDGKKMNLDKDILFKGNKIYSSETCVFVPQSINMLFVKRDSKRGNLPIGVGFNHLNSDKYIARSKDINGKLKHIGSFNSIDEAFKASKIYREGVIKSIAESHKGIIPDRLYYALIDYRIEKND